MDTNKLRNDVADFWATWNYDDNWVDYLDHWLSTQGYRVLNSTQEEIEDTSYLVSILGEDGFRYSVYDLGGYVGNVDNPMRYHIERGM